MQRPIRRIVTGHNQAGLAVIDRDETTSTQPIPTGEAFFAKLWTTNRSPADNQDPTDGAARPSGLTCPGGSVLRIVDIPPGQRSPMHRTHSVDYGIVLQGELDMELDSGETVHLVCGDVVVQRGTNHAWINRSANMVRMAFVLIDARPIEIGGKELEQSH
jgi:quercetin dioxygenase-like cupin family protein